MHHKNKMLMILSLLLLVFLIAGCGNSSETTTHEHGEESHGDGLKYKVTEQDREVTAEEQKILNRLYSSDLDANGLEYGDEIYSTVTITGKAMPEESIFSVKDLEELIRISFTNQKMHEQKLFCDVKGYYGLDFIKFIELCGADLDKNALKIACTDENGNKETIKYKQLKNENTQAILALGDDSGPFGKAGNGEDIQLIVVHDNEEILKADAYKINIGTFRAVDPEYRFHDHGPYKDSLDIAFTIEVYQDGAEYLGPEKTVSFTTAELEKLMKKNPDKVVRNYYGTIGNEESFLYAGVGGWVDYFEGIDFLWLLQEKVGIESLSGRADLIDRDGEVYNTVDDLRYFNYKGKENSYYILTADGVRENGCIPMIACVKNGYPILKEHEHESAAYVAYNHLNSALADKGIVTEVGVVKNHNGPFTACFGNLDGYYGGEQVETAGDCVLIRIYLK